MMIKGASTTEQEEMQSRALAAAQALDFVELELVRAEALRMGMCVNRNGLCDEDRCYCGDKD